MALVACIPNISLGQNPADIARVTQHITRGCRAAVLHTDIGADAHRTVLTLAAEPQEIIQAALLCMEKTFALADMTTHHGTHPRLGAVDVCPLVALQGITLAETAVLARQLGQMAAQRFGIPVYLYAASAQDKKRQDLSFIRRGGYEHLEEKLQSLPPDFGPCTLTPVAQKLGACVVGARDYLIAFNVNLNTQNVSIARAIAAQLRAASGGASALPTVKAIGWYMAQYGCAQVSFNLTDFKTTGLHTVFEACKQEAQKHGLTVTGSEVIGLPPLEALLSAGRFYAPHQTQETALLRTAVAGLDINTPHVFNAQERILEFALRKAGLV